MSKFTYTFNFKTASKDLPIAEAIAKLEQDNEFTPGHLSPSLFEAGNAKELAKATEGSPVVARGAKRKSLTVELEAPDWIDSLPKLAADYIKQAIADFVRATYVDSFLPVGQHDWEFIEQEAAKSGRSGGVPRTPIEEAIWSAAAKSFEDFIMASVNNKSAATRLAAIMAGKFSQNAITKQAAEFNLEILAKLSAKVDQWAVSVVENDPDNAEDFGKVYAFIEARVKKHKQTLEGDNTPLASIL